MATDWAADVKKYAAEADDAIIAGIVRYCGIALRNTDSALVAFSDPKDLARVRNNFLKKKLGRSESDADLDAAIAKVGNVMKGDRTKNRVTVYYLLADHFKALDLFAPKAKPAPAKTAAKAPAKSAAKPAAGPAASKAGAKIAGAAAIVAGSAATPAAAKKSAAKKPAPAKAKTPAKKTAAPAKTSAPTAAAAATAAGGAMGLAAAISSEAKDGAAKVAQTAKAATSTATDAAKAAVSAAGEVAKNTAAVGAAAVNAAGEAAKSTAAAAVNAAGEVAKNTAAAGAAAVNAAGEAAKNTAAAGAAVAGAVAAGAVAAASGATSKATSAVTGSVQGLTGGSTKDEDSSLGGLWWLLGIAALLFLAWWLFWGGPSKDAANTAPTATEAAAATGAAVGVTSVLAGAPAEGTVTIPTGAGITTETRDGKPVVKVYFDSGKIDLVPDFGPTAGGLKAWLAANPGSSLAISGYADPSGNAALNAELAKKRAKAVQAALVEAGVPEASALLVKPENVTDASVAKDAARRVEVVVK
ncbi:MAG: DUF2853 family protein [Novosphingobium sp.]